MGEYSEADRDEREDSAFAGRPQGLTKTEISQSFPGNPSPLRIKSTDVTNFLRKICFIFRISVASTGRMKGRQDTGIRRI